MIVKVPVYFSLVLEEKAKVENVELLKDHIAKQLEEHLSGSSFKLAGSWWNDNSIKAKFLTQEEALKTLMSPKNG
jgi:hypothetical protein